MSKYDDVIIRINDNLNKDVLVGKCKYLLNKNERYQIFIHNKIMISMARLAEMTCATKTPFIQNYKFFLDDEHYPNAELPYEPFSKYISFCLNTPVNKDLLLSHTDNLLDFCAAINKYNIKVDNYIANFFKYLQIENMNDHIATYVMATYFLYGIIVNNYLEKSPEINIDLLNDKHPFNIEVNEILNKINIYTPLEEQITLHYFCIAYLRTNIQRSIDYPAIFDKIEEPTKYRYSDVIRAIYHKAEKAHTAYHHLKKCLKQLYEAVNLDYSPTKIKPLTHDDFSMLVLWHMFCHHKSTIEDNTPNFDPIIKDSENIIGFFSQYNLENLNDYDTLCSDRKETNKGTIINTFIMNATSKNYVELDCTSLWNLIIDRIIDTPLYYKPHFVYDRLYTIFSTTYYPFDLPPSINILDEYKYLTRFYNFVTGIDEMKKIYTSICNSYDEFKNIVLPIPKVSKATINDFFKNKFIENELYVVSPAPTIEQRIKSLKNKADKTKSAYKIICQQQDYLPEYISAFIWLHHNGNKFKVQYPNGYKSHTSNTHLAAVIKGDKHNSRFHQLLITQYVSAIVNSTRNYEFHETHYHTLMSLYTDLMDFIDFLSETTFTPHQKTCLLYDCLLMLTNELCLL